ncbi:ATP-binding protein [Paenibacillus lutrae]|uniref:histidine kinase n=1 Tax=Paenibacillus lutrae TaxID=2078573 RepID=A0A7X3FNX5_9BACL|nr:ATP-binding protein [Paenibacillus lutrae]MVP02522.1 PAS domain S-box protein [Paenibacillus lutrae]
MSDASLHQFGVYISTAELGERVELFSQSCLIVADGQGDIVYVNRPFLKRAGFTAEELIHRPFSDVIQLPDSLELFYKQHFSESAHESNTRKPVTVVKDRHGFIFLQKCSIIRAEKEGQPLYLMLLDDLDEMGEQNLIQQFSGTFLRDVNLGILLIDTNFRLLDISDMACRILGFRKESILYKPMDDIFASVPPEHRLVERSVLEGRVVRNHAVSWMNNQSRYELLLDSNLLRDVDNQIVGAYIIFKDVTNIRSLEAQVQRSDRLAMIGQIAAGTAHEIRNPLTSIKGFLQVLKKTFEMKDLEKEQGYIEIMLDEINRVNELVNEFLLLGKPKNVLLQKVDISSVIKGILPIMNNEAILHEVQLRYEAAPGLPHVIADQELLKQVFLNICKNGIEALTEGGQLTITEKLDEETKCVHIEVHDTGPGIPPYVIDKIFDPFFTTKQEGTGLGLSVCQRIIHDMGGNIRVSSKGFGTTFTVSIPCV